MGAPLRWWAIIPARWNSRRLPGKVGAVLAGRSMLEHVWRAASATPGFEHVAVAADGDRVMRLARSFGARVHRTGPAPSGTVRASLVAPDDVAVAVIQADQPGLRPGHVLALRRSVEHGPIGTLWAPWSGDPNDPSGVKIRIETDRVVDFARTPWPDVPLKRHVGLYAFRPGWLGLCTQGVASARAEAEDLEQLTWLDRGYPVSAISVRDVGPSVDTWPQLVRARASMAQPT